MGVNFKTIFGRFVFNDVEASAGNKAGRFVGVVFDFVEASDVCIHAIAVVHLHIAIASSNLKPLHFQTKKSINNDRLLMVHDLAFQSQVPAHNSDFRSPGGPTVRGFKPVIVYRTTPEVIRPKR